MSALTTVAHQFQNLPRQIERQLANVGWFTPLDVLAFFHAKHPHARTREDAEDVILSRLIRETGWGPRTIEVFLDSLRKQEVI